jgi:tetratricopeptide (TPR) repeat protein
MRYIFTGLCIFFSFLKADAQPQDTKTMQETAKSFTRQGDFANATMILSRALEQQPGDFSLSKDLALNYYFQKDHTRALNVLKPLLDHDNADDQVYQITGSIYRALAQPKDWANVYKKGLKKFPNSGALYAEYGESLWTSGNTAESIKQWEKGIEADPNYAGNYYYAAKFYYFSVDRVWSLLYGEIFLNMEPQTSRSAEMKNILLESYKKLFTGSDAFNNPKEKNGFVQAFLRSMEKQRDIAALGLNPETLTMIRTRFILDWFDNGAKKYPFRLFEHQQQLLREGMFDAYNQWIFGAAQNLVAYQKWTTAHPDEYSDFSRFQKGRIFKMPGGQHYQTK